MILVYLNQNKAFMAFLNLEVLFYDEEHKLVSGPETVQTHFDMNKSSMTSWS